MQTTMEFKREAVTTVKTCPCCGHQSRIYKRPLLANMSLTLLLLFKNQVFDYVHVEKYLKEHGKERSGDFHKLVLWGLLQKKSEYRNDGCKYTGFYKITGRGLMFCENKLTVQKYALICNNEFLGFEGENVTILDTLGSKFNYNQLMGVEPTPQTEPQY